MRLIKYVSFVIAGFILLLSLTSPAQTAEPNKNPAGRAEKRAKEKISDTSQKDEELLTYTDEKRHFRFQYPKGWKITSGRKSVMHYKVLFLALNNDGKENFWVENQISSTGGLVY